ncbi:MAG: hypothetical protein L0177_11465 [Chloroflexi bacterium]|nr:hypothetical protein [Chloroflexota bacterium]
MGTRRNSSYKVVAWLGAVLGLLALAVGCSSPSPAEAEAALCNDLALFEQSVGNLTNISIHSNVGELKTARNEIQGAFDNLKESAAEVSNDRVDELIDAFENLAVAINNLPNETTIPDAAASLQEEVAAVTAARQGLGDAVDCP